MARGVKNKDSEIIAEIEKRIDANDLLSPEEKAEIRARAKADVLEARKKIETERLLREYKREEERAFLPNEALEKFTVDLPEYTPNMAIDAPAGRTYWHGVTYVVTYSVGRTLADLQARAWEHDREIQGRRRGGDVARDPFGRGINAQRDRSISMATGAVTTTGNMRI